MLETSIAMGGMTLKNRFVMSPIALEKSDRGAVTQELLDFYDERTRGGYFGFVIVENSCVHEEGRTTPNQLSCAKDEDIPGLSKLADILHKNGSRAVVQLSYAGAAAKKDVITHETVSPSGIPNPNGGLGPGELQNTHAMTQTEINAVVKSFAEAAVRVQKAGFDGVELQVASGYLLNQFFSPLTNHRADDYTGQTLEGRLKLTQDIISAIRNAAGRGFCRGVRIGGDYTEGGNTVEDCAEAANILEDAGLDFIDISGGLCFFVRPGHNEAGYFSDASEAVKRKVKIPVILSGGFKTRDEAEKTLAAGQSDLIGFGRIISAHPDYPKKIMES